MAWGFKSPPSHQNSLFLKESQVEYTVEEISPVKKKINIKILPEEADAAIMTAIALYRKDIQMAGFRKGKVPASIIEKRYHDTIYREAKKDLIQVHIDQLIRELGLTPVGGIRTSGDEQPLQKGNGYEYSMEFETMPVFELPLYDGMEVEEEEVEPEQDLVEHMLKRIQRESSTLIPVEGNGPAQDGQIANIDFETFLDGKPVDEFRTTGFDLEIAEHAALPEFVEFVKTIPVGHTAEKVIHFPKDFIAAEIADKDATMKVTVHAIKERLLPELNDKFAEKLGKKDMEEVRADLAKAYAEGLRNTQKAFTQRKLLDRLIRQTDYEVPPSMVDMETTLLVGDRIGKAEQEGKRIVDTPADVARLREELKPEAERRAREKVLLLEIAKKENLEVSMHEVESAVYRGALQSGQNVQDYFEKMRDTGMIYQLKDNMLTDKAMDLVYEKAKITPVKRSSDSSDETHEAGANETDAINTASMEKSGESNTEAE